MILVHAAQKVVLEGCRFIDCTLVVVSGADVELKDTDFTQGKTSTYGCSIVASGGDTMISMHDGKITGGTIGVTVYGGATASLTEVAVEQITVSGVEARDAGTRGKLTSCSLQNFKSSSLECTHAVHAHKGSSMHLDTMHIQGADDMDYGVLVHTNASVCMRECTVNETKVCGTKITDGSTGDLTECQFDRNELGIHVTGHGSCCDAQGCFFRSSKTGAYASRMGKVFLQQCHATEAECGYRATSGAAMRNTKCTSKGGQMGWCIDMPETLWIAQDCVGTDVQGSHEVVVAGGATADLFSCTFTGSSSGVVQIQGEKTFASLAGCTVSKGKDHSMIVERGAQACLKRCTLSDSTCGLSSFHSGTRVDVIDCVSKHNTADGFSCFSGSKCVVSESRSAGNGGFGYVVECGGRMTVTDCCSEKDKQGGTRTHGDGSTINQQRLRVYRV